MAWIDIWGARKQIKPVATNDSTNKVLSTIYAPDGGQGVATLQWAGEVRVVGVGATLEGGWTVKKIEKDSVLIQTNEGAQQIVRP